MKLETGFCIHKIEKHLRIFYREIVKFNELKMITHT